MGRILAATPRNLSGLKGRSLYRQPQLLPTPTSPIPFNTLDVGCGLSREWYEPDMLRGPPHAVETFTSASKRPVLVKCRVRTAVCMGIQTWITPLPQISVLG